MIRLKAVIMSGGIGSRLKPLTETSPKPLIKIVNRPVLDMLINKLIISGISEIYISLGYMANDIINYCESKKYNAELHYVTEVKPLGTAGGVKNCIGTTDEEILVISGDNIFDFDINDIYNFHISSDADITLCGVKVEDPREYGVVVCDEDSSICSFIEKPTWENANGNLVNTGIYILKGSVLDMIPENRFFDFSDDLFPLVFNSEMRFMCYNVNGYWGDMGEIASYIRISSDIINGKFVDNIISDRMINEDITLGNGSLIKAPCIIPESVKIGENSIIGPNCVFGNNCEISDGCHIEGAIIGSDCAIGENCDIKKSVISDKVSIRDNCCCEELTVIGYGCTIGRFSRLLKDSKIWPGRRIEPESVVNGNMFYENPATIQFDSFGLSGKINSQITVGDAAKLGQAVASVKCNSKIGIGCDSKESSDIYKDLIKSGIRSCGKDCYDFGVMFKTQTYFFASYCSLDAFIYISTNGDVISFSFYGKSGMPLDSKTSRAINNNFKFSSFEFNTGEKYKETYNFSLFSAVYQSFFKKLIQFTENNKLSFYVETENDIIVNMFRDIFPSMRDNNGGIQILINSEGTDFYIIENEKVFSADRIFLLICELQMAEGKDVLIPEDAPSFAEKLCDEYKTGVLRVYSDNQKKIEKTKDDILNNIWFFDPILLIAKTLNILSSADISLSKLFDYQRDFSSRKMIIDFDGEPSQLREILGEFDSYDDDGVYKVYEKRNGKARMRQMGNTSKIRLLVEAADMEAAKEISVSVAEKIKKGNIDKEKQKL